MYVFVRRPLTYIDLNMVRAGAVAHPSEWEFGGYAEVQAAWGKRSISSITDYIALMELTGTDSIDALLDFRRELVDVRLGSDQAMVLIV
jgi:putative transposase